MSKSIKLFVIKKLKLKLKIKLFIKLVVFTVSQQINPSSSLPPPITAL